MVNAAPSIPVFDSPSARADAYLKVFRYMLEGRAFEEKIAALYRAGKVVGGVYLGRGQEAFSASLGGLLDQSKGDVFAGLIRDQAGRMAFGEPVIDSARTYLGSVEGPMRGRDGNIHRGRPTDGMPAMISHLGSLVSVVNGMLIAKRFQGKSGFVGGATIGDGGTSTGAFHEAINQAAVEKLPLVVSVANNQIAYSTSTSRQFACDDLADRAEGYGVRGYSIDGTDPEACVDTFGEAIARARGGEGPQLVVGKLLRLTGHGEHDDARYVPEDLKTGHHGRDCIEVATEQILGHDWMEKEEIEQLESEIREKIESAMVEAQADPKPNPMTESWHCLSNKHLTDGWTVA